MSANHYGLFDRVSIGIYELSPNGRKAIADYAGELALLPPATPPDGDASQVL